MSSGESPVELDAPLHQASEAAVASELPDQPRRVPTCRGHHPTAGSDPWQT
jgi:hypothetical protein